MKIQIVHYNPQDPGKLGGGGAESAVRDEMTALRALGHEVFLSTIYPQRDYARLAPDVVHFHTIHIRLGLDLLSWAQTRRIPHCISLHDYWPFCYEARMLLRRHDEPCPAVEGLCDESCGQAPASPEVRALVNGSPTVVFNPTSQAIYQRHGIRTDFVVPHGIDTEFFRPREVARVRGSITMSAAFANQPTKGLHVYREALRLAGLQGRLITGVPRERVRDLLQEADIFVFPSTYEETWGLSLSEALATGCACVGADVAGAKAQIKEGETGRLFPKRDALELASILSELVDNPGQCRQLGRAARAWAEERLTLARLGADYERVFGELAGRG
jgi:glycosyltransferase involved in cell wall biosynthesis